MGSKMGRATHTRVFCSCLLCNHKVDRDQMGQHYDSKRCNSQKDPMFARLWQYANNKRMSISDVETLLEEAGITIDQVGVHRGEYALARYGDSGPYVLGNCRFITMEENLAEMDRTYMRNRVYSAEERERRRQNMIAINNRRAQSSE